MANNGALTFRDIAGKLDVLRVACRRCDRQGRYQVARLIAERGLDASLIDWRVDISADCPRANTTGIYDRCQAHMPDLPKVV